jgi:uncharacterized protein with HEPN domain
MIKREEEKYLSDTIGGTNSIDKHVEKQRIFSDYLVNKTKRRAVERALEIIGDAMSKLLKTNPTIAIS